MSEEPTDRHGEPLPVRNRQYLEENDGRISYLEKFVWATKGAIGVLSIIAAALAAALFTGIV